MKLKAQPRIELLHEQDNIIIPIQKGSHREITEFLFNLGQLPTDKEITVKIEIKRSKRSLDANAYFWTLVGKLGAKLNRSDIEIYRELIKDNGVFTIVPIREDAIEAWIINWAKNGKTGWVCDDLGECRNTKGYHNIKCYYGTSRYDSKQFARILDAAIEECKAQNIDTDTPEEIERMKALWG